MAKQHWIVKTEPEAYAWADFERDRKTTWDGVRNYQARNHLRAMRLGDRVLFYASVTTKAVLGTACVSREAFPDPTAQEGDWSAVGLTLDQALPRPVELATLKADPALAELPLLRQSRLSVMPVTREQFSRILALGGA